jgi:hypothetical protein
MLRAMSRDDNRRATDARDEKRELLPAVQRALSEEQIQVVAEKIEAASPRPSKAATMSRRPGD